MEKLSVSCVDFGKEERSEVQHDLRISHDT